MRCSAALLPIKVKLPDQDALVRIMLDSVDYTKLRQEIRNRLLEQNQDIFLSYQDSDFTYISIASNEDLSAAFHCLAKSATYLRIYVDYKPKKKSVMDDEDHFMIPCCLIVFGLLMLNIFFPLSSDDARMSHTKSILLRTPSDSLANENVNLSSAKRFHYMVVGPPGKQPLQQDYGMSFLIVPDLISCA